MSIENPKSENSSTTRESISNELAGAPQIESIEIIDLVGTGGMSVVFRAWQKQLDRIVAVKVLSRMVMGDEGVKRFQQEAKLTSTLEHSGIVKIFSCGVSIDGQPYIVMEYLNGRSVADELKQNGPFTLQKFSDVFLSALSALEEAHQKRLIHRDVKPANLVLCRTETGVETVKLVDFGIAKSYGEGILNLTEPGSVLGAPMYMSPEQCHGRPLDGRSDLYSLACVMYEALSGQPPFSGTSALEVMQKHSLEPPPTVSDLMQQMNISKPLAQAILLGLNKDPGARPQTASDFARKIKQALEDTTLTKVPELRKAGEGSFILLTIGLLSIMGLVLGILVVCSCLPLMHAQTGREISYSLSKKQKEDKEERECKNSLARFERAYGPDDLEVAKRVEHLACNLYLHQNRLAEAEALLKRSLQIREKLLRSDHPTIARNLLNLGDLYKKQGRYAEAEPLFKRCLQVRESVLGPEHHDVGGCLFGLGELYFSQKRYAEAEPLLKRCLRIWDKALGAEHPANARCLFCLGDLYMDQGKYSQAKPLFVQCLQVRERALGLAHPDVAVCLLRLGELHLAQRNYSQAEPLLKRCAQVLEKDPGPEHPDVGRSLFGLANLYTAQGKYAKAEPLFERGLQIKEKALGPENPDIALGLFWQGEMYRAQGKFARAEPLLKRSLRMWETTVGADHAHVGVILFSLGELSIAQRKYTQAESLFERSLHISEKTVGLKHPNVAAILFTMGELYMVERKYVQAEQLLKRCLCIREKSLGLEHQDVGAALFSLANLYSTQRKYVEAESFLKRGLRIKVKVRASKRCPRFVLERRTLQSAEKIYTSRAATGLMVTFFAESEMTEEYQAMTIAGG